LFNTEDNEETEQGEDFFTGLPTDAQLDELAEREFANANGTDQ